MSYTEQPFNSSQKSCQNVHPPFYTYTPSHAFLGILTLRLVAVYAQNKAIVRSLYIIYGVSYLACAVFTVMAIRYNEGNVHVNRLGV
jgi:hypothetical protein